MGPNKIIFTSDECQCLLDVFDRIIRDNLSRRDGKTIGMFLTTEEERISYKKLVRAGKFYMPTNVKEAIIPLTANENNIMCFEGFKKRYKRIK